MKKLMVWSLALGMMFGTSQAQSGLESLVDGIVSAEKAVEKTSDLKSVVDQAINTTNSGAPNIPSLTRPTVKTPYDGTVFNGPGLVGGANAVEKHLDKGVSRESDIKQLIIDWTNFALAIVATLAVVALVWAGALYVTAMGDDSRMEKAKNIIIWCLIGILVILAAYAVVNTVMQAAFN